MYISSGGLPFSQSVWGLEVMKVILADFTHPRWLYSPVTSYPFLGHAIVLKLTLRNLWDSELEQHFLTPWHFLKFRYRVWPKCWGKTYALWLDPHTPPKSVYGPSPPHSLFIWPMWGERKGGGGSGRGGQTFSLGCPPPCIPQHPSIPTLARLIHLTYRRPTPTPCFLCGMILYFCELNLWPAFYSPILNCLFIMITISVKKL